MYCRWETAALNGKNARELLMSLFDTFKTYNLVTLTLGIFCVAVGVWTITELALNGVRTAIGAVFVVVLFVLIPVSLGMAIIHNQLRLRKNSK